MATPTAVKMSKKLNELNVKGISRCCLLYDPKTNVVPKRFQLAKETEVLKQGGVKPVLSATFL